MTQLQFSDDDKTKILQWMKERTSSGLRCFVCGLNQWTLLEMAAMTLLCEARTGRIHYMDGFPLVGLMCPNCGHIIWFSAAAIGLRPEPVESPPNPPEESAVSAVSDAPSNQGGRRKPRRGQ